MLVAAWSKLEFFKIIVGTKHAVCVSHIRRSHMVSQIVNSSEDLLNLAHFIHNKYTFCNPIDILASTH